jgi:hypothetical protein
VPQHSKCVPGYSQPPTEQWPIKPVLARRAHQVDDDQQGVDGQVGCEVDQEPTVVACPSERYQSLS